MHFKTTLTWYLFFARRVIVRPMTESDFPLKRTCYYNRISVTDCTEITSWAIDLLWNVAVMQDFPMVIDGVSLTGFLNRVDWPAQCPVWTTAPLQPVQLSFLHNNSHRVEYLFSGFVQAITSMKICTHVLYHTGIILCMRPVNERRRYNVTSSLIGWAHGQNDPCTIIPKGIGRCVKRPVTLMRKALPCH